MAPMKITPDSSLLTALSNSPLHTGERKRATPDQGQIRQNTDKADIAAKDDLIRRALADGNLRQQAVKMAQAKRDAVSTMDLGGPRGSVTREVPFPGGGNADSDSKPQFKRLGQLLDLRV